VKISSTKAPLEPPKVGHKRSCDKDGSLPTMKRHKQTPQAWQGSLFFLGENDALLLRSQLSDGVQRIPYDLPQGLVVQEHIHVERG